MLDYYGSILKKKDEIILDIINHYKNYNQDEIKIIVEDLMVRKEIHEEYSISGWMVFFHKECIEKINKEIEKRKIIQILNKKIPEKYICEDIYLQSNLRLKSNSSEQNNMDRVELIAQRSFENNRNPLDTAGMDTDDEIWIYENPQYEDTIMDHYNSLKK